MCAARTKQSLGCGRPSEASRDPRVWKAPYGYPMGYHVDTMWSTLWGTLWRPRNPRGYPQNPWILERDSRETQDSLKRLKRDSRETVSTTPKAWIPKSEKSEMRTDTTHSSSKSSSNKRKSDTKGEGGK